MKKLNSKKGFTIVELVIVIAVIAILAAVLIPTFSSVTQSAKESAALSEANSGMHAVLALTGGTLPSGSCFYVDSDDDYDADYCFAYEGQKLVGKKADQLAPYFEGSVYSIYVAETSTADSHSKLTDTAEDFVLAVAGRSTATNIVYETNAKLNCIDMKIDGTLVAHIYYTGDFATSMIAFVSNGTVTEPTEPAEGGVTPTEPTEGEGGTGT